MQDAATIHDHPAGGAQGASSTGLLAQLIDAVSNLFRKETELFRSELDQAARQAAAAIGMVAGGAIMALVALNVLAAALVAALTELGVESGWAALIVGGGIALIALILVGGGAKKLKASSLAPTRSMRSAGRDAAVMKEAAR
jgi:hypothetical protein